VLYVLTPQYKIWHCVGWVEIIAGGSALPTPRQFKHCGYLTKAAKEAAENKLRAEFVGVNTNAQRGAAVHGADHERSHELNASSQRNENGRPGSTLRH